MCNCIFAVIKNADQNKKNSDLSRGLTSHGGAWERGKREGPE